MFRPGSPPADPAELGDWLRGELERLAKFLNDFQVPIQIIDAATVTVNAEMGNTWRWTLGGNRTLANPTNVTNGQQLFFRIAQDVTGGRTLAYGSKIKVTGTLVTTANAVNILALQYDANDDTFAGVLNTIPA